MKAFSLTGAGCFKPIIPVVRLTGKALQAPTTWKAFVVMFRYAGIVFAK